jgi:hypothetical protein
MRESISYSVRWNKPAIRGLIDFTKTIAHNASALAVNEHPRAWPKITMNNVEQFRVTPEYLASQGLNHTAPARFFSKIRFTESCWIWFGTPSPHGYGYIGRGGRIGGMMLAHRMSWVLHFGPIPEGMNVCHDCPDGDNPKCVNPAHLWIGSHFDNVMDKCAKGRQRSRPHYGESHGRARLKWEDVLFIRENPLRLSLKQLIARFGVSRSAVTFAKYGRTWHRPKD